MSWLPFMPLAFLVASGLIIMLADAFAGDGDENGQGGAELATLTSVALFAAGAISLTALIRGDSGPAPELLAAYLTADTMGLFFDVAICLGAGLSALLAGGYLREHGLERGEFYLLLLFSALGAMILARATDMLSLFIGLETMSLGVYAMVGYRRSSPRAVEGAVKYFLLGSFAAAILLFGAALIYAGTGATGFAAIGATIAGGDAQTSLVILGMLMVLVGLAFKVSAVPFHMWTPDAYEGAVTPATTFMSIAVKASAFAVLVRVCMVAFGDELSASAETGWPPVLAGLAVVSMVYGNLAAAVQNNIKRMLAYSSIAHAGYILVGLAAAFRVGESAITAVFFYLLAYTVSNVLAFGSLIILGSRGREATSYADIAGVGRRHPMHALPFVLGVLTLMGFPPTAGFFAKYYVFNVAIEAGGGFVWLAILGVLASAIGAYYYLRVVVSMFMKEPEEGAQIAVPMQSGYVAVAVAVSALLVLNFGLLPGSVLKLAEEAARQLLG